MFFSFFLNFCLFDAATGLFSLCVQLFSTPALIALFLTLSG
jgi:hypothetical protein